MLNLPAGQDVQLLALAKLYVPAEQLTQLLADEPLDVPAAQSKQLIPSVEYVPPWQATQTVFEDELIVPALHLVHFVCPIIMPDDELDVPELTQPFSQVVQADEPALELNFPSVQGKQLFMLIEPIWLLYVPGSHATWATLPVGQ